MIVRGIFSDDLFPQICGSCAAVVVIGYISGALMFSGAIASSVLLPGIISAISAGCAAALAARLLQTISRRKLTHRVRLDRPPGGAWTRFLEFVFPRNVFEVIFCQAIADMREEYFEPLAHGAHWKARWIIVRDNSGLAITVVFFLKSSVVKKIVTIWKLVP